MIRFRTVRASRARIRRTRAGFTTILISTSVATPRSSNFAPLSGGVLAFSGSSTFAFGVASFTSVTLTNPGDSIAVAMNFALTGTTTASGLYGPVIGLFNHGGTPLTADISSLTAATADDFGFELIYERGLSGDLFFVPVSNASPAADFAYEVRNPALTWDSDVATVARCKPLRSIK